MTKKKRPRIRVLTVKCPNCMGLGKVPDFDDLSNPPQLITCSACNGTGKIKKR